MLLIWLQSHIILKQRSNILAYVPAPSNSDVELSLQDLVTFKSS